MNTTTCIDCGKEMEFGFNRPKNKRCKPCAYKYYKEQDLKSFGISIEEYENLLIDQLGVCAICGNRESSKTRQQKFTQVKSLAVDHCHKTGKVRGLLCSRCNVGLGMFKEDINILVKAIKYLDKHK